VRRPFHNRDGDPVEPWPFVVVAGTGALPVLSFGPLYLGAFGVPIRVGVGVSVAVSAVVVAVAYHRLVLTYRPDVRTALPASERARRLFWVTLVLVGVFVLLSLPLVGRSL
jgi:phosphotransferase system  glucose/maltose/N-acetylglucosamine-specific IIC component